jgi:hypothetical protein
MNDQNFHRWMNEADGEDKSRRLRQVVTDKMEKLIGSNYVGLQERKNT